MKIVFFHTDDAVYSSYAALMESSLKRLKMDYHKEVVSQRSWLHAVNFKPEFLLKCRENFDGELVYIDADAFVHKDFSQDFMNENYDIAFCRYRNYWKGSEECLTGTIFLRDVPEVYEFLKSWTRISQRDRGSRWDQATMIDAIEELKDLKIYHLPLAYTHIFDNPTFEKFVDSPVIEHLQASRTSKQRHLLKRFFGKKVSKNARASLARKQVLEKLLAQSSEQ